jgi:hypothetical protein
VPIVDPFQAADEPLPAVARALVAGVIFCTMNWVEIMPRASNGTPFIVPDFA